MLEKFSMVDNSINIPPEEYGRKIKTQKNRRYVILSVEHVV